MKRLAIIALLIFAAQAALALTPAQRIILFSGGPRITLSNTSIASTASVGSTVGTLSVLNGKGSYTFTLTSNPGSLYSISGALLKVAASLSPGSDPITVQASNGAGSVVLQPFTITVTGATSCNGTINLSTGCAQAMLGGL